MESNSPAAASAEISQKNGLGYPVALSVSELKNKSVATIPNFRMVQDLEEVEKEELVLQLGKLTNAIEEKKAAAKKAAAAIQDGHSLLALDKEEVKANGGLSLPDLMDEIDRTLDSKATLDPIFEKIGECLFSSVHIADLVKARKAIVDHLDTSQKVIFSPVAYLVSFDAEEMVVVAYDHEGEFLRTMPAKETYVQSLNWGQGFTI